MIDVNLAETQDIAALILAGGQSRRFSHQDKGLIPLLDKPMVQHVIERLASQANSVTISCNSNIDTYRNILQRQNLQPQHLPECIADLQHIPFIGPLAGIYAFLNICSSEHIFICPCDIPLIPVDIVQQLNIQLDKSGADACYPVDEQGHHHLLILVRRDAAIRAINEILSAVNIPYSHDEQIAKPILSTKTKQFSIKNWLSALSSSEIRIDSQSLGLININSKADMTQLELKITNN